MSVLARCASLMGLLAILLIVVAMVPLVAHAQSGEPVLHSQLEPILLSMVGALAMGLCSLFGGILFYKTNSAVNSATSAVTVANEALRLVSRFEGLLAGHTARLAHIEHMIDELHKK